jgi:hypothetical protein
MLFWPVNRTPRAKNTGATRAPDEIATIFELARYLGCSPATIYRLIPRSARPHLRANTDEASAKSS